MIVVPNCTGTTPCREPGDRRASAHRPATAALEHLDLRGHPRAPAAVSQTVPGPLLFPVERGGPGTGSSPEPAVTGRSVLAGRSAGRQRITPAVAARLAEPDTPGLFGWLDYRMRGRRGIPRR